MSTLTSLTLEGTLNTDLYNISVPIKSGNMMLMSTRFDLDVTDLNYEQIPKSLNIEIGTIIGTQFVIDNTKNTYFKVGLNYDIREVIVPIVPMPVPPLLPTEAKEYLISTTYPQTGFRMNGDLNQSCTISIRTDNGDLINQALLKYFYFHFQVIN